MQINMKINDNYVEMAEVIRKKYYGKEATVRDYRDSFIFGKVIDGFGADTAELRPYIDDNLPKVQKKFALRKDTYEKLETIAKTLDCTVAAVYRAIVRYSFDNIDSVDELSMPALQSKVKLLEKQLKDCQQTLDEIKRLV